MSNSVQYETHRLVNKRSGKLASTSTWLLDLAACAVALEHNTGLPSLLPQNAAKQLLKHNELKPFKRHKNADLIKSVATSHDDLRQLAQKAVPAIAHYYMTTVVDKKSTSTINRKGFVHWIASEMLDKNSGLNRYLLGFTDYAPLAETIRGERWWLDQIKMQSKS